MLLIMVGEPAEHVAGIAGVWALPIRRSAKTLALLALCALAQPAPTGAQAPAPAIMVTGSVWIDRNVDGLRQADEPLIPGVYVDITWAPATGTQTMTDGSGHFRIE